MKVEINKNNYVVVEETGNNYDVVVAGGGLAGVCAALSAARLGCKVAFVQDRPVLGGNSSNECRVVVGSAGNYVAYAKETGIIDELLTEDRAKNHTRVYSACTNSTWDLILYDAIRKEKNIKLFLSTSATDVVLSKDKKKIAGVKCFQPQSEKNFILNADVFIDSTGDGTVAYKAGAEYRMGREARSEFNETQAPIKGDDYTMGSTLMFRAEDVGQPVPYTPPDWIQLYETNASLGYRIREHGHEDFSAGYWWIEIGNPPYEIIADNDKILHELYRHVLGVWNYIKNYRKGNENLVLDWVGSVPAKRESRRIVGDYILSENDIRDPKLFPDRVTYGGLFIDVHTMGAILATKELPEKTYTLNREALEEVVNPVFSIPLRSLYSKNIDNLLMAGRQISVTHVALGATRIMGSTSVQGQAVGAAAYLCKKYDVNPRDISSSHIDELQQLLLKQDCYIPSIKNEDDKDLARSAKVTTSSSAALKIDEGNVSNQVWERCRNAVFDACNLSRERLQTFPISSDYIDYIELLIESRLDKDSEIEVSLGTAETIWDIWNTEILKTLKATTQPVKSKDLSWVKLNIDQEVTPNKLYWISVKSEDGVFWAFNENPAPPGVTSTSRLIKKTEMQSGYYAMRIFPESRPYGSENIISGVARPEKWTNIWISDPSKGLPQHVELDFGKEVSFNTVYLAFDTNLNKIHIHTEALYFSPECVKDYKLLYDDKGSWKNLLSVTGNYYRRRVHNFENITSSKLRLVVNDVNGKQKTARLYEIRIYDEK